LLQTSLAHETGARLEYGEVVCPHSLEPVASISGPVQLAVAVWLDGVRLIDNVRIDPREASPDLLAGEKQTPASGAGYAGDGAAPWLAERSRG